MINSALTILNKYTNNLFTYYAINCWFQINALTNFYKITRHLMFHIYVYDSLKIKHIKIFYKQFNVFFVLEVFVKIFFGLSFFLFF